MSLLSRDIGGEVGSQVVRESRDVQRDPAISHGMRRETAGGHAVPGRNGRGGHFGASADIPDKFRNDVGIRSAMAPADIGDIKLLIAVGIVILFAVPEADDAFAGVIAKIFDPAGRTDDGVVAPGIGCIVALLVGTQDAIVELHLHQAEVFDIDDRV